MPPYNLNKACYDEPNYLVVPVPRKISCLLYRDYSGCERRKTGSRRLAQPSQVTLSTYTAIPLLRGCNVTYVKIRASFGLLREVM